VFSNEPSNQQEGQSRKGEQQDDAATNVPW